MDIEYLLFLQNFRNSINDAWTPFMEWISYFGIRNIIPSVKAENKMSKDKAVLTLDGVKPENEKFPYSKEEHKCHARQSLVIENVKKSDGLCMFL